MQIPAAPPAVDPFVDLQQLQPLFRPTTDGRMEIGAERMNLFRPASFSLEKSPGTFRVFALGGSTTYGEPYSSETAFPYWLGLYLQAADADRTLEVINCGGLSYASYRVLAILREVLDYEPDLIVIYTGHNEYLERRSYAEYDSRPWWQRLGASLADLKTVQLVRLAIGNTASRSAPEGKSRTVMQAEVDALLDYQGGLEAYTRAAPWREPVVEHFRWNVEQMTQLCRAAAVPLMLIKPVSNLLDCPPLKFEVDKTLSLEQQQHFDQLWQEARRSDDRDQAITALMAALQIDPGHADANYLLGKLYFLNGEIEMARVRLVLAKDLDVCPLRATTDIQTALEDVAIKHHTILFDADQYFGQLSEFGLVGNRWLVDHVHPTVEGHQQLGEALAIALIKSGTVSPPVSDDWLERGRALCRQHLSNLGEEYFHRGKQRLEGLLLWTQGRAKKIRESTEREP